LDEFVFAGPKFNVALFSIFAILGLTLAVIGVYGVMSSNVAQQTQEIGIRVALGASPRDVIGLVLVRGAKLLAGGIALGIVVSYIATRLLRSFVRNLSGFESLDHWTVMSVAGILAIVAMLACWIPARRATMVDPLIALRSE
jgi:ABC-type antimicrobial peptide transport system permease subunit